MAVAKCGRARTLPAAAAFNAERGTWSWVWAWAEATATATAPEAHCPKCGKLFYFKGQIGRGCAGDADYGGAMPSLCGGVIEAFHPNHTPTQTVEALPKRCSSPACSGSRDKPTMPTDPQWARGECWNCGREAK